MVGALHRASGSGVQADDFNSSFVNDVHGCHWQLRFQDKGGREGVNLQSTHCLGKGSGAV